jgi:hypothetical protein
VAAILTNVPIKDLLEVLSKLSSQYYAVDIIIDPDEKTIIIEPVENDLGELNDDNIYKLV